MRLTSLMLLPTIWNATRVPRKEKTIPDTVSTALLQVKKTKIPRAHTEIPSMRKFWLRATVAAETTVSIRAINEELRPRPLRKKKRVATTRVKASKRLSCITERESCSFFVESMLM